MTGIKEGKSHELVPFTDQSAGLIHEILPAAEIIRNIIKEAEETIRSASSKLSNSKKRNLLRTYNIK